MTGNLNQNQINYLLETQMVGRIGCALENRVYVVPINYVYDGTYIYGHSMEGTKISMMRKSPEVCFEVEDLQTPNNWRTAIVWGEYQEITSTEEIQQTMQIFLERMEPYMTSLTAKPKNNNSSPSKVVEKRLMPIFFKIKIKEKTGRFEK